MAENQRPARRGEKDAGVSAKAAPRTNARRKRGALGRLNLFDAIVILLVLVVVVLLAVGVRVSDLFGSDADTSTISYTLTLYDVDQIYADTIKQGDEIYDVDSGALLGKVTAVPTIKPHTEFVVGSSENGVGIATETPVPGRVDITLAVRAEALYREGKGYSVNSRFIRVGATYSVRFPDFLGSARCVSFDSVSVSRAAEEGVQ